MGKLKDILKNCVLSLLHILWVGYTSVFNNAGEIINADNILLIHLYGIGNMIFFTPVIKEIRKHYLQAKITVLIGSEGPEEVIEGSEYVNNIVVFDTRRDKNIIRLLRLTRKLRKYNFDLFISSPMGFLGAFIGFFSGAKYRIAHYYGCGWFNESDCLYSHCVKEDENSHEVERNLSLVKPLGIKPDFQITVLFHLDAGSVQYAREYLKINEVSEGDLLIGVHPGCNRESSYRRWPAENFVKLSNLLRREFRAKLIIFGGPEEEELVCRLGKAMAIKPIISIKKTLKETAALIGQCHLLINTDSGLGHIGAALGVPTITIFGPTNPVRTRPWGQNIAIVKKDYECMPCYIKRGQKVKCKSFRCIRDVDVDMVVREASRLLEENYLLGIAKHG